MSKDAIEYHAQAAGASSNMSGQGFPELHVEPPFVIPADTAAALSETACAFAADLICMALEEDGPDLTSLGIFPPQDEARAYIVAKQRTLVVGLPLISLVLSVIGMDPASWSAEVKEGSLVESGTVVARLHGHTIQLLKAERVILNLMTHLSGVADLTRAYVEKLEGTGVRLLDTRKTTPNMRVFEKYAVRVGGGNNHRYNLSDGVLLKDNHIGAAGGVAAAVKAAKAYAPFVRKIEIEVETLEQLKEALDAGADIVMLDNMSPENMAEAVKMAKGRAETECSGNVTRENISRLIKLGVDYISSGALTHSAPILDISLKNLHPIE